jgi:hypothetical protein
MSSKWGSATLVVAIIGFIMFVDIASAQQQGRRGGGSFFGRGGLITLAAAEPVQNELVIDAAAKEKIAAIQSEFGDEIREQMQAIGGGGFQRDASDEDRQKMFAKFQETSQKVNAKYIPKLKEVLKDEQFTRLQQINWQASGAGAFSDPELVKTLKLSDEQQKKIADVNRNYMQNLRGMSTRGGGNAQEATAKMREFREQRDKQAEEVLTKEQQDQFKELKGKPFDVAQLRTFGQGSRRGDRKGNDK